MLVLTRRDGEALILDGGIRIVVLSSDSRGVRLGIEAPRTTGVLREELVREVASANRSALARTAKAWVQMIPLAATRANAPAPRERSDRSDDAGG